MDTSGKPNLAGTTLSHYRILSSIGAGGMGEVYRATDTNLGRDVALKVLPAAMADDANRLARLQRETRVTRPKPRHWRWSSYRSYQAAVRGTIKINSTWTVRTRGCQLPELVRGWAVTTSSRP